MRTIRRFAEEEIVIPDGPYAGRRFRCHRQPYTGLWFDAVDCGRWPRCVATGPTQSGKTLSCFLIPLLYHLFEIGETVICGLPDMDMAADKWREDILPAIERSRYRELLPSRGGGSRGGRVESLQFANGATLKFMSGGGGDKSRAGFTSRVVVVTETDGLDQPGGTSRESDKITQLEARTKAYGARKRIYLECTVSTEEGRTWREYQNGTRSRIVLPCPHCGEWVSPEREHLAGWQEAQSQEAARQAGHFQCPHCQRSWDQEQRIIANRQARLLHDGQTMAENGRVEGELPATDTLGFRWSGVNNLFLTPGDLAADEWRASRAADEENAEREMRQFVWCLPVIPAQWDQTSLAVQELASRTAEIHRGFVPVTARWLTAAIDLGKYLAHWIVVAWSPQATLLVPLRHYALVSSYIERTRLRDAQGRGQRLVYHCIRESRTSSGPLALHEQSLLRKLDYRTGQPLLPWITAELQARYNYRCCDTVEEFQLTKEWALTCERHIKHTRGRHEKDDRDQFIDRRRFVLGWDNHEKRRSLEAGIQELKQRISALDAQIGRFDEEQEGLRLRMQGIHDALAVPNYAALDFGSEENEILALQREKEALEQNNDVIRMLKVRLGANEEQVKSLEETRDQLIRDAERLEGDIKKAETRITNAANAIAELRASGEMARAEDCFADIEARLGDDSLHWHNLFERKEAFSRSQQQERQNLQERIRIKIRTSPKCFT